MMLMKICSCVWDIGPEFYTVRQIWKVSNFLQKFDNDIFGNLNLAENVINVLNAVDIYVSSKHPVDSLKMIPPHYESRNSVDYSLGLYAMLSARCRT